MVGIVKLKDLKTKQLFTAQVNSRGDFVWMGSQHENFMRAVKRFANEREIVLLGISVEVIEPKRTDSMKGFYWLRNSVLAGVLGMRPTELHVNNMRELGFGHEVEVMGNMVFTRASSEKIPIKQYSELIRYQDIIAEWWNEGKELNLHIKLPEGDPEKIKKWLEGKK